MADVTGPISSLPGARHAVPKGTMCDDHPDRPAVQRIQGETDSFGSEMNDLCQECVDEMKRQIQEQANVEEQCDWCKTMQKNLRPHRDFEEGSSGRVYDVCPRCISEENKRVHEELDNNSDDYFDREDFNDCPTKRF